MTSSPIPGHGPWGQKSWNKSRPSRVPMVQIVNSTNGMELWTNIQTDPWKDENYITLCINARVVIKLHGCAGWSVFTGSGGTFNFTGVDIPPIVLIAFVQLGAEILSKHVSPCQMVLSILLNNERWTKELLYELVYPFLEWQKLHVQHSESDNKDFSPGILRTQG